MSTATEHSALAPLRGNFVLLRADSLRLLLPQEDVGAAEYISGMPDATGATGIFAQGEGDAARNVVALSGQMRALPVFPQGRFLLTRLGGEEHDLSFAWSEVRVLIGAEFAPRPLPSALRMRNAPIVSYVEFDGEITLCTTAASVVSHTLAANGS